MAAAAAALVVMHTCIRQTVCVEILRARARQERAPCWSQAGSRSIWLLKPSFVLPACMCALCRCLTPPLVLPILLPQFFRLSNIIEGFKRCGDDMMGFCWCRRSLDGHREVLKYCLVLYDGVTLIFSFHGTSEY